MKPDKRRNYSREEKQWRGEIGRARVKKVEDDFQDEQWDAPLTLEQMAERVRKTGEALTSAVNGLRTTIMYYDEVGEIVEEVPKLSARQEKKARKRYNREKRQRELAREAEELVELEKMAEQQADLVIDRNKLNWGGF